MTSLASFHSSAERANFLGLRTNSQGTMEIVFDDGAARRMVWRVKSAANAARVGEALKLAVDQARVVPALLSELKKRAIAIEDVTP